VLQVVDDSAGFQFAEPDVELAAGKYVVDEGR
jgi:hypothetical protein